MNLAEAVGEGGGMTDTAADPAGVFLFRLESGKLVSSLRPDLPISQSQTVPVIYRVNLRSGDGYFLAREFPVRDKDILLLANSDGAQLLKFMTLVRSFTGTADDVGAARYFFTTNPSLGSTVIHDYPVEVRWPIADIFEFECRRQRWKKSLAGVG